MISKQERTPRTVRQNIDQQHIYRIHRLRTESSLCHRIGEGSGQKCILLANLRSRSNCCENTDIFLQGGGGGGGEYAYKYEILVFIAYVSSACSDEPKQDFAGGLQVDKLDRTPFFVCKNLKKLIKTLCYSV